MSIAVESLLYIVALVYKYSRRVILKYINLFKYLFSKASLININSTIRTVAYDLHI